jgi:hypothetical protein
VDAAKREQILTRYMNHARRFDRVAAARRRNGNGHLAACHHPLNVDMETLARVSASPRHTPAAADESATPTEPSGPSRPVVPEASDR